jgi:predicted nucleic acid-binding Zn ribbon protein
MVEKHSSICSSCGCPAEAGHSKDCQLNREEQSGAEYTFSDLLAELEGAGFDKDKILDICTEENIVGHGGNADVYKIPNVEKICFESCQMEKGRERGRKN